MSNREGTLGYITRNHGQYCDDCLSDLLNIHPRQQVNTICRDLANRGYIDRYKGRCTHCQSTKVVNGQSSGFKSKYPNTIEKTKEKIIGDPANNGETNVHVMGPKQFEDRVNKFVARYFHNEFSEQALDLGQGKMHKFDLVSADRSIIVECKSYTWTEGGNFPSGKIATLKEALFYFSLVKAERKILVMHHRPFPKKEPLVDVFFRQNRQLIGDVELWDYIVSTSPMQDKVRIVTSGDTIIE